MNIKHRVHRFRYIDWHTTDDDFELYEDELMSDETPKKHKRDQKADNPALDKKLRERQRIRSNREPEH
jgi:hypothetical protein